MKTFKISAKVVTFCSIEIKADSLEEALSIADDTDAGDFTPDGDETGYFKIMPDESEEVGGEGVITVTPDFYVVNPVATTASLISQNLFEEVRSAGRNGTMYAHHLISKFAEEFEKAHEQVKEDGWEDYCAENGFSDWEECIVEFVKNKIKDLNS